ncbi:MAG TPA: aminoacyl-tRNA hydrolase [Thermoanaerobaculia bacterium]|nr:aminoacyl-tRNA hydrolase [Thermoanaerobaculia bacterium]
MRLVVGLGNPGPEYAPTRHNLGFRVVLALARRRGIESWSPLCAALTARSGDLLLACPQTYMNRSGLAVRCLVERGGPELEGLLVVYDDLALPLGRLRLRAAGGPGGHRGMASILEQLRSDAIPRLRLGIGPAPAGEDLAAWVLAPFEGAEREAAAALVERAADACEAWLTEDLETVAARVNAPAAGETLDDGRTG